MPTYANVYPTETNSNNIFQYFPISPEILWPFKANSGINNISFNVNSTNESPNISTLKTCVNATAHVNTVALSL